MYNMIRNNLAIPENVPMPYDVVIDIGCKHESIPEYRYYLSCWEQRAIAWIENVDIRLLTNNHRSVYCPAHLSRPKLQRPKCIKTECISQDMRWVGNSGEYTQRYVRNTKCPVVRIWFYFPIRDIRFVTGLTFFVGNTSRRSQIMFRSLGMWYEKCQTTWHMVGMVCRLFPKMIRFCYRLYDRLNNVGDLDNPIRPQKDVRVVSNSYRNEG